MRWGLWIVEALAVGALALLFLAASRAFARRWCAAVSFARLSFALSFSIVFGQVAVLSVCWRLPSGARFLVPAVSDGTVDPSEKARVLGATIAQMMNACAFALLVGVAGGVLWCVARRRCRATSS